jgi:pyruvate dehydrogenase E1 component alpha subunit
VKNQTTKTRKTNSTAKPESQVMKSSNGTATKTAATPKPDEDLRRRDDGGEPEMTDNVNPVEAHAEHEQRKANQKSLIDNIGKEKLLEMLDQMILARRFEEKCAEVYRVGKIGGFCHLYIGQEAVAIGALGALESEDMVIASYRDHVHAIVKGMPPEEVMAELYGKAGGSVGGKGGSMHFFDQRLQFYGGHGIVGGQIPVGTGMAYAAKYRGSGQATLCFFGEAAVNQGSFHESLNMAQLWKLPVVFICENNQYGMGTSQKRAMSIASVSKKGEAYGMANEFVDGMDVLAVFDAVGRAVKRAKEESLPTLLEIRCYRYMGHSMSDPGKYREQAEIEKYRERDPIHLFEQSLKEAGVIDDAVIEEMEKGAAETVEKSIKFADESPLPDEKELFTDIYA